MLSLSPDPYIFYICLYLLGGVLMYYFGIFWIDPLISALIAFYLIWASFGLVKESSAILMQFTPKGINVDEVVRSIEEEPEIEDVHHIHVWKLDDNHIHLEAHLDFKEDVALSVSNHVIDSLEKKLHKSFDIEHTTFQCEYQRSDDKHVIV
ncbi:cation diffusion facilitator family transporter [Sulfurovum sp.]|uniref:cation diffusion facilitator family transporter n=1 Tax=Sulfurovum sp. TaxID=1969726 RepID=UPI0025D0FC2D|nr:cation diffusion facilitator family transporter [Sulfurovum sp.]